MRFQDRIHEHSIGSGKLYTLQTGIEDVVSWRGVIVANPVFDRGDEMLMHLLVALLDKGTKRRDRFAIADVLENRGAQLGFNVSGLRIGFWGRALKGDVSTVLGVMAEQLREPLFDADEFEKARQRLTASVRRGMESTGHQASSQILRRLYPPAHPNYSLSSEEELDQLRRVQREEVIAFYERHVGANELLMVMVGDLDEGQALNAAREGLESWEGRPTPAGYAAEAHPTTGGARLVHAMPDRMNLDVRIGHALRLRRDSPDYAPLYLANHILGGNFSSRLMDIVRDDMGLTYGIHSTIAGISSRYDGHWNISVTLSQENLERGIAATLAEVTRFVDEGPTARELEENITTITGSYKVKLATTGGLADAILGGLKIGAGTGHLDAWPERIASLTEAETRAAIARYFAPDHFDVAIAGTLPDRSVIPPE
ncbi:MAG: pitrilysin family protein [Rhodothermales bacterium]|nr:pitrilysin family protein [Rhodothermales bacterium]